MYEIGLLVETDAASLHRKRCVPEHFDRDMQEAKAKGFEEPDFSGDPNVSVVGGFPVFFEGGVDLLFVVEVIVLQRKSDDGALAFAPKLSALAHPKINKGNRAYSANIGA